MKKILPIIFLFAFTSLGLAAQVPESPCIAIVYRYGDAIIKSNRDTHSFAQNDLRILYTLSELSNKPAYRDAADAQLKWLLQNQAGIKDEHRPWMLWDRCFEIDPDRSKAMIEKSGSVRALAAAYQYTKDEKSLKLIELAMVPARSPIEQISLAIDCWGAASRVPKPLASKLREFAQAEDQAFLSAPAHSPQDARLAMLCVSRYENTGNAKYRDLFLAVANFYEKKLPIPDPQMSPMTYGHIISLELAAWRSSSRQEYLDSAQLFARMAVVECWNVDASLPKVKEGSDTLVLSLLELHLSILHITAVRCPPNTIDR